jgi:hypothetical protein
VIQAPLGRPQLAFEKLGVALSHLAIIVALQRPRGLGKGAQHQPIPRGEPLVITSRMDAFLTRFETPAVSRGQCFALLKGVDHWRFHILVAEESLNRSDVIALL